MVLLVIAAIAIVRFVSQATRRVIWLVVVCLLLLGSYGFRSELGACSATCDCRILARNITVPTCVAGRTQTSNPGANPNSGDGDAGNANAGSSVRNNNVQNNSVQNNNVQNNNARNNNTATTTTGEGNRNNSTNGPVVIDGANEAVRPGP